MYRRPGPLPTYECSIGREPNTPQNVQAAWDTCGTITGSRHPSYSIVPGQDDRARGGGSSAWGACLCPSATALTTRQANDRRADDPIRPHQRLPQLQRPADGNQLTPVRAATSGRHWLVANSPGRRGLRDERSSSRHLRPARRRRPMPCQRMTGRFAGTRLVRRIEINMPNEPWCVPSVRSDRSGLDPG